MKLAVVTRLKNETYWLPFFVRSILRQSVEVIEVIVVDNSDQSHRDRYHEIESEIIGEIGDKFDLKLVEYPAHEEYFPGKALNLGVSALASKPAFVFFVSVHCVFANFDSLKTLVDRCIESKSDVGYGRQRAGLASNGNNQRDLAQVFRCQPAIQVLDGFFHNAFSIIKYDLIKKVPFDEKVKHAEDWAWGASQVAVNDRLRIAYESKAEVYHCHGINQHAENSARGAAVALASVSSLNDTYGVLEKKYGAAVTFFLVLSDDVAGEFLDELTRFLENKYPISVRIIQASQLGWSNKFNNREIFPANLVTRVALYFAFHLEPYEYNSGIYLLRDQGAVLDFDQIGDLVGCWLKNPSQTAVFEKKLPVNRLVIRSEKDSFAVFLGDHIREAFEVRWDLGYIASAYHFLSDSVHHSYSGLELL